MPFVLSKNWSAHERLVVIKALAFKIQKNCHPISPEPPELTGKIAVLICALIHKDADSLERKRLEILGTISQEDLDRASLDVTSDFDRYWLKIAK